MDWIQSGNDQESQYQRDEPTEDWDTVSDTPETADTMATQHPGAVFLIIGCCSNILFGMIILIILISNWNDFGVRGYFMLAISIIYLAVPILGIVAAVQEMKGHQIRFFIFAGLINTFFGILTVLGLIFCGCSLYYAYGYWREYKRAKDLESRNDLTGALDIYIQLDTTKDIERIVNVFIDEKLKAGDVRGAYKLCAEYELIERGEDVRRMATLSPVQVSAAYQKTDPVYTINGIDLNQFRTVGGRNEKKSRG